MLPFVFADRRGRRSLHAYLNVIIDLLDDRFLTAKQTNSTIHCRDWRPRQSAKTNGSSKPLPYKHDGNPRQTVGATIGRPL